MHESSPGCPVVHWPSSLTTCPRPQACPQKTLLLCRGFKNFCAKVLKLTKSPWSYGPRARLDCQQRVFVSVLNEYFTLQLSGIQITLTEVIWTEKGQKCLCKIMKKLINEVNKSLPWKCGGPFIESGYGHQWLSSLIKI